MMGTTTVPPETGNQDNSTDQEWPDFLHSEDREQQTDVDWTAQAFRHMLSTRQTFYINPLVKKD
jgi:hypothetical protein